MIRFSFAAIACVALVVTSVGCGGSQTSTEDPGLEPTTTEEMEKRMKEMQGGAEYDKMKQMSGPTAPGQTAPPAGN
ncbi:MAG: hypothetical protein H8E66_10425 [Planctomycetes bacterium]|nr:hypothetical protein [Planctomycetota bacterium]